MKIITQAIAALFAATATGIAFAPAVSAATLAAAAIA